MYFVKKNTAYIVKHEKHTIKNKIDKNWKRTWNNAFLVCKDFTHNFSLQEVKMTNKVLIEKNQTVLFVDLVNQDF